MRAEAILFDKDGTLFDFQKTWAPWTGEVICALADGDPGLRAALAEAWGYDMETGRISSGSIVVAGAVCDLAEAVLPLLPEHDRDSLLAHLLSTSARVEGVEVVALVGFLAGLAESGLQLGLATNDAESVARAQLRRVGVEAAFDFIAGYDSGHGGKPAPGMCLAFVAHTGLPPERILMVGDSPHDIMAGRAAGMQTLAVLSGVAGREDFAALGTPVLPDISHLPAWLRSRGVDP